MCPRLSTLAETEPMNRARLKRQPIRKLSCLDRQSSRLTSNPNICGRPAEIPIFVHVREGELLPAASALRCARNIERQEHHIQHV